MPYGYYYRGASMYREVEQYAAGNQPVNKYKKSHKATDPNNETSRSLDFSIVPIIPKYLDIAKAKIIQRKFEPTANAIDPVARGEEDLWYSQMAMKITAREAIAKQGGNPDDYPALFYLSDRGQDKTLKNIFGEAAGLIVTILSIIAIIVINKYYL